jgi:AraC-like DNA-binding protein
MRKNQDCPETLALALRAALRDFAVGLADGRRVLCVPPPARRRGFLRGDGHFHLAPELFLQVTGWTRFRFPGAELRLEAGQALLVPPQTPHAERVGAGGSVDKEGAAFRNLVVYADGATVSCHVAHEAARGRPGILHLEASRHAQAARIAAWLDDAAGLADAPDGDSPWVATQRRALVAAATAATLRAVDAPGAEPEPALIARVRLLVRNQLGDATLGVRGLAAQCGCTPDHLSQLFRRSTGEALAGHIVRLRMERAAHLLRTTRLAGKEIAWACGYTSPSYFVRSFRAAFATTPRAWRGTEVEAG